MPGPPDPRLVYEMIEKAQKHARLLSEALMDARRLTSEIVAATPEIPSDPFSLRPDTTKGDIDVFDAQIFDAQKAAYDIIRLDSGASMVRIDHAFADEISSRWEQVHDQITVNRCTIENPKGNASEFVCGHRIKWIGCNFRARDYCVWMSDVVSDVVDFLACLFADSITQSLVRIHHCKRLSFVDCDFVGPTLIPNTNTRKASIRLYSVSDSVIRRCRFENAGSIHINGPEEGYADGPNGRQPNGDNHAGARFNMTNITGSFDSETCPINIANTTDVNITDSDFTGRTDTPVWLAPDAKRIHIDVMYNGKRYQEERQ